MTLAIGYLIPEFPGQTHVFFWREIQALRRLGICPDLVSTRRPPPALVSHDWAPVAMAQTEYLFPPRPLTLLAAGVELLRAGPRAWWRGLRAAFGECNGLRGRLRRLSYLVIGASLVRLARQRRWRHVHVHSCGNAANVALFANLLSGLPYSLTLHGPLSDYGPDQPRKWHNAAFAVVITQKLKREVREALHADMPPRLEVAPWVWTS